MDNIGNRSLVTIDGTDMKCEMRFDKGFYSFKFRKQGLKYEVGVCIRTGHIVWVNGPFPCATHDFSVANQAVVGALEEGEELEADLGYVGDFRINTPNEFGPQDLELMKSRARHRHETVNARLKLFDVLKKPFRHDLQLHSEYFRAIAVITQINIETDSPTWQVEFVDKKLR